MSKSRESEGGTQRGRTPPRLPHTLNSGRPTAPGRQYKTTRSPHTATTHSHKTRKTHMKAQGGRVRRALETPHASSDTRRGERRTDAGVGRRSLRSDWFSTSHNINWCLCVWNQ
jgi:hypothetical protein